MKEDRIVTIISTIIAIIIVSVIFGIFFHSIYKNYQSNENKYQEYITKLTDAEQIKITVKGFNTVNETEKITNTDIQDDSSNIFLLLYSYNTNNISSSSSERTIQNKFYEFWEQQEDGGWHKTKYDANMFTIYEDLEPGDTPYIQKEYNKPTLEEALVTTKSENNQFDTYLSKIKLHVVAGTLIEKEVQLD